MSHIQGKRKYLQGTGRGRVLGSVVGVRKGGGGGFEGARRYRQGERGKSDSWGGEGRNSVDKGDRGREVPSWRLEGRVTFGEGLGGISLHAEVVDQHDGKMLLHISRHQVPCMSRTPPEQVKLGEHNYGNSHPRLCE